ncbi:MAG TPA: LLM class flavin-dependent oxidoreductase [Actinophytocola sp.]|uniref:LLM class flavin-dependent oxidoreductase n=1 Tax=Actinophytocola sp. TaxID=1872138 RepID=UPI002DBBCD0C|nr:LLM class flavin-dependent oxidoreductase [Actinophytocola sp.]HEU5473556.1 LLM class flavin-dependent oxidoreductase [Actinophytocola sp.]
MKFGYFSHVWGRPGATPAQRYEELWREIELADEVGFDYAFSVEHHFSPSESWMSSPAMFCTGAAARTDRIRVGPMGYVPALHNPIAIVEEIAALDQVLNGRLEVGIASGVAPTYFGPFGAKFEERKERAKECVDLLRAAYGTDDDSFGFTGPFHEYSDVSMSFAPVQRPHPPLWIPTRDRRTLRWLAEIGAHTSSTMIVPRKALEVVYRHYVDWWKAAGHPGVPNIGYWTLVHVGESDEEAISRAAPHLIHTLTKTLLYGKGTPAPETGNGELSTADILANAGDINFLLDNNLIFVGSPETVADRIRAAADEGVFNTLLGEFTFGMMSEAEVEASTRLFATEVMPALADHEPYGDKKAEQNARKGTVYDESEERLVSERLQALGYIE